jgi:hypothetical protein
MIELSPPARVFSIDIVVADGDGADADAVVGVVMIVADNLDDLGLRAVTSLLLPECG